MKKTDRPRKLIVAELLASQVVIAIAFLPWLPSLLYQTKHAGHPPLVFDNPFYFFLLPLVWLPLLLQGTVLGYVVGKEGELWTDIQRWIVFAPIAFFVVIQFLRLLPSPAKTTRHATQTRNTENAANRKRRLGVILTVPVVAWLVAVGLSPWTNLALPACIVTLAPLFILFLAYCMTLPSARVTRLLANSGSALLLVSYAVTVFAVSRTTRSNARELAAATAAGTKQSDLVIVAPEWLASSFNRYYTPTVQQIDFPHFAREGAVDFDGFHRAAEELFFLTEQDHVPVPFAAEDVVLPLGAQDAGFGHQEDAVYVRLGAVAADHLQPGRGGEDVRLAKTEANPFAKLKLVAVGEEHGR
jgi:hypothetical protein